MKTLSKIFIGLILLLAISVVSAAPKAGVAQQPSDQIQVKESLKLIQYAQRSRGSYRRSGGGRARPVRMQRRSYRPSRARPVRMQRRSYRPSRARPVRIQRRSYRSRGVARPSRSYRRPGRVYRGRAYPRRYYRTRAYPRRSYARPYKQYRRGYGYYKKGRYDRRRGRVYYRYYPRPYYYPYYYPYYSDYSPVRYWVWVNIGAIPVGALISSYEYGEPIYYCRGYFKGRMYYGNLYKNRYCKIKYGNRSINLSRYQVLISE